MPIQHGVKDLHLADAGRGAIEWVCLKLHSMDVTIDLLTDKQEKYLASWEEGT